MIKVAAFYKAHPTLTHDQFRAGFAGHNASAVRRFRDIRGHLANVWSERDFPNLVPRATRSEPAGFFDLWDGLGEFYFDTYDQFVTSPAGQPDKATDDGLVFDDMWPPSLARDAQYLFAGAPVLRAVEETVVIPTVRPERLIPKLVQFAKRADGLSAEEFARVWTEEYAPLHQDVSNVYGFTVNIASDGITGLEEFASRDGSLPTTNGGEFTSSWDGYGALWLDSVEDLRQFRERHEQKLTELENCLFDAVWYREVDETIGVMPRRGELSSTYVR